MQRNLIRALRQSSASLRPLAACSDVHTKYIYTVQEKIARAQGDRSILHRKQCSLEDESQLVDVGISPATAAKTTCHVNTL